MTALGAALSSLLVSVLAQHVTFDPGTHDVNEELSDLDHVAEWVGNFPEDAPVMVTGFACEADKLPNTTEQDLLEIADTRAIKLRQELVLRGVDPTRISTIAYGVLPGPGTHLCQATARVEI